MQGQEIVSWTKHSPLYRAVLLAAQGLAAQYLASRDTLCSWYSQFDTPSARRRIAGAVEDPSLDYDPRRYYDASWAAHDPINEALYEVKHVYENALRENALRLATEYMVPLRVAHTLIAALDIYGMWPDEREYAQQDVERLQGNHEVGAYPLKVADHCDHALWEVLAPPTITFRRQRNGDISITVPTTSKVPENLAYHVNQFRNGDGRVVRLPPEETLWQRENYHWLRTFEGMSRKQVAKKLSVSPSAVDSGLREYAKDWLASCGGEGLPLLKRAFQGYVRSVDRKSG